MKKQSNRTRVAGNFFITPVAIVLVLFVVGPLNAQVVLTPENIEEMPGKIRVETKYTRDGFRFGAGLVSFKISIRGDTYAMMKMAGGYLAVSDDRHLVLTTSVMPHAEKEEIFYSFNVQKRLLENSVFRFRAEGGYEINLKDWHTAGSPLIADFKLRKSQVAVGDTLIVDMTITSTEHVKLGFGSSCQLGTFFRRSQGRQILDESATCRDVRSSLEFTPGESRAFSFRVPVVPSRNKDGSWGKDLVPAIYSLGCWVRGYSDLGLTEEFSIEIIE